MQYISEQKQKDFRLKLCYAVSIQKNHIAKISLIDIINTQKSLISRFKNKVFQLYIASGFQNNRIFNDKSQKNCFL